MKDEEGKPEEKKDDTEKAEGAQEESKKEDGNQETNKINDDNKTVDLEEEAKEGVRRVMFAHDNWEDCMRESVWFG